MSSEEGLGAVVALVIPELEVQPLLVVDQGRDGAEGVAALGAQVMLLTGVGHVMDLELLFSLEGFRAVGTLERTSTCIFLHHS